MHQETAGTGELVGLFGDDPNRQLLAGQIGTGSSKFSAESVSSTSTTADCARSAAPELLERVLGHLVGLGTPRSVAVGSHRRSPLVTSARLCISVERIRQTIRAQITRCSSVIYITTIGVRRRACSSAARPPASRVQTWSLKSPKVPPSTSTVSRSGGATPAGDHRRGRALRDHCSSGDRPDQAGGRASGRGVQRAAGPDRRGNAPSWATRCRCRRWSTWRRPSWPTPRSGCSTPAARAVRPARSPARCATSASRSRPPRTTRSTPAPG